MNYTISFFINGYGQQPDDITNTNVIPELPVLAEDGFSFEGWYLDEDLTVEAIVGTSIESDIVLYASWSRQRGGWGSSTNIGASTYAKPGNTILGPDIGIVGPDGEIIYGSEDPTPDKPDTGTGYLGASNIAFNGGIGDKIFKNNLNYNGWFSNTEYSWFNNKGTSLKLPPTSPKDTWTNTITLSNYTYNYSGYKGTINTIEPGTKPQFFSQFYVCADKSTTSTTATHKIVEVYRLSDKLKIVTTTGSSSNTVYFEPSECYDGSVPKRIIAIMQGGGGPGAPGRSNKGGTGGSGGGLLAIVVNLDNAVSQSSSLRTTKPTVRFGVPTIKVAGSFTTGSGPDGEDCYLEYPTSVSGSNVTYTKVVWAEGGYGGNLPKNNTSAVADGSAGRGYYYPYNSSTYESLYEGTAYWPLTSRQQETVNGQTYTYYNYGPCIDGEYAGATVGTGGTDSSQYKTHSATIFHSRYGASGHGENGTDPTYSDYSKYWCFKVQSWPGGSSDTSGSYGGATGGGASAQYSGGSAGKSSGAAGGSGTFGSGGGGGAKGSGKGGNGGGGTLYLWY